MTALSSVKVVHVAICLIGVRNAQYMNVPGQIKPDQFLFSKLLISCLMSTKSLAENLYKKPKETIYE